MSNTISQSQINATLPLSIQEGQQDSIVKKNNSKQTALDLNKAPEVRKTGEFSLEDARKIADNTSTFFTPVSFLATAIAGAMQITNLPESNKKAALDLSTKITQLFYTAYGSSGFLNGLKKKNVYQMLGFGGEAIFPWLGKLKDIYLLRGMATGLDQLWSATDPRFAALNRFKNGTFPDLKTGFVEMSKELGNMIIEILKNPVKTLLTTKPKGHPIVASSVGNVISTLGFLSTKNSKIFGPIRDLSAFMFDIEMLFKDSIKERGCGALFIAESLFDFAARVMPTDGSKQFLSCMSHAVGRLALHLYKSSDTVYNSEDELSETKPSSTKQTTYQANGSKEKNGEDKQEASNKVMAFQAAQNKTEPTSNEESSAIELEQLKTA